MIPAEAPPRAMPWPPLITAARLPWWAVWRDVLLTLLAWILLGWLLRDTIYLIYDFIRFPIFQLTTAQPPDFPMVWGRLSYFVILAASLIGALLLWAFVNRDRLAGAVNFPQPKPLTIAEQAARFGVDEAAVQSAREFKITSVKFRDDGTLVGFKPGAARDEQA